MAVDFEIDTEFRSLCPQLTDEEYKQLEANIVAEGEARDALCVWEQEQLLLDGHNRLEICERHNLPYEIFHVDLADRDQAKLWIIDNQRGRRNLTPYQRCELEHVRESLLPGRPKGSNQYTKEDSPILANAPPTDRREEAASRAGVSHGTYSKSKVIASKATDQEKEELRRGDKTINEVHRRIKGEEKRKDSIFRVNALAEAPTPELGGIGPHPVIVADPPWKYEYSETSARDIDKNHYPTMHIDDLCELDISQVVGDDCVLFLWATSPKAKEAFELIEAWGFTYKTSMVWVKNQIGMGYYARQKHELLLIAGRGNLPVPEPHNRPESIFVADRGKHSEKPEEAYRLIDQMYPELHKLELFARKDHGGLWRCWGKEI